MATSAASPSRQQQQQPAARGGAAAAALLAGWTREERKALIVGELLFRGAAAAAQLGVEPAAQQPLPQPHPDPSQLIVALMPNQQPANVQTVRAGAFKPSPAHAALNQLRTHGFQPAALVSGCRRDGFVARLIGGRSRG